MNRFASAAVAGAVALSFGVSVTGASADRWHHHYYEPAPRQDVGPALLAGTMLGLAVGALMQPEPAYPAYAPPPPPPDGYADYDIERHFEWCTSTYETYNGETDTWIDYRGVPHRCVGP